MEHVTTYRVKGKDIGLVFLFKYDLNGFIRSWEVTDGEFNAQQSTWLFAVPNGEQAARFPVNEQDFREKWLNNPKLLDKFDISVRPADISFKALWTLYDHKVAKQDALKAYNKLKEDEIIMCFVEIPYYLEYLKRNPGIGKLHLATYINKRRFEDERLTLIPGNHNPMLAQLASQKTDK